MQEIPKKRIRGTNFSKEEELSLVHIISEHEDIIENKSTSAITPHQREETWHKIEKKYNSLNRRRSLAQIKSKYDNLKTSARKVAGNVNRSLYGTGGGPSAIPNSNPVYDEMLCILNKKTVAGMENPYDDDYMPDSENANYDITEIMGENIELIEEQDTVQDMEESSFTEHAASAIGPKDQLNKKEKRKYTSFSLKQKELG